MKKLITIILVLLVLTVSAFAFNMNETKEQFQFTYFNGIADMDEGLEMGLTFYPNEKQCIMYIKDYTDPDPETNTQILAYGGFKFDAITDFLIITMLDNNSEVVKLELEITSEYVLSGTMEMPDSNSKEWVVLQDRYFLIVKDEIDNIIAKKKAELISQ